MDRENGVRLWLITTPIGNLGDLAPRALEVLGSVDAILCEDTRHSRPLLQQFGIDRPLLAYHDHNERTLTPQLIEKLGAGQRFALISDAGTPLICDPGYRLVAAARAAGITVSTVPGPCAAIVALTLSGFAIDRFAFEGFLPAKASARRERLARLAGDTRTLVLYEAKSRIKAALEDIDVVFGTRRVALARELTKRFEQVRIGRAAALAAALDAEPETAKGEFVIVIESRADDDDADAARLVEGKRLLRLLSEDLPPSAAARIAARISGAPRQALYDARAGDTDSVEPTP